MIYHNGDIKLVTQWKLEYIISCFEIAASISNLLFSALSNRCYIYLGTPLVTVSDFGEAVLTAENNKC